MSQKRSLIQSIVAWLREHWLFVIGMGAVLIPLVFWTVRPISSAIFRLYAQDCGSLLSVTQEPLLLTSGALPRQLNKESKYSHKVFKIDMLTDKQSLCKY